MPHRGIGLQSYNSYPSDDTHKVMLFWTLRLNLKQLLNGQP